MAGDKKRGRPADPVPQDLADELCAWIAEGKTLREWCRQEGKPHYSTVYDWRIKDESFAQRFAHAREIGYDVIAQECLAISDNTTEGVETTVKADGGIEVKRGDMLGHRKLQIETRLKLLAKWSPKRYGELVKMEHTGADGGPIEVRPLSSFYGETPDGDE